MSTTTGQNVQFPNRKKESLRENKEQHLWPSGDGRQVSTGGKRRNSYPDWFEEFWKAYPSNRGSKKVGLAQAKKVIKSESDIREAIAILNRKTEHIRRMQAAEKWVASLPHVERYFSKGLWDLPLDQEQTEFGLRSATYGRSVSRKEIEIGNRHIAEWKTTQLNRPVEATA